MADKEEHMEKWNVVLLNRVAAPRLDKMTKVQKMILEKASEPIKYWASDYSGLVEIIEVWQEAFAEYVRQHKKHGIDWRWFPFTVEPHYMHDHEAGTESFIFSTIAGENEEEIVLIQRRY